MRKELLNQVVEHNGEKVEIKVVELENDNGLEVVVEGEVEKVTKDNQLLFMNSVDPNLKHIPPGIKRFVKKKNMSFFELEKGMPTFYLYLEGREFACSVVNERIGNRLEMRDWLLDAKKIYERCNLEVDNREEGDKLFKKLKKDIKELGYELLYSHDADEYDNVYYLSVPIGNFDEEKVNECIKRWGQYNQKLEGYIKE